VFSFRLFFFVIISVHHYLLCCYILSNKLARLFDPRVQLCVVCREVQGAGEAGEYDEVACFGGTEARAASDGRFTRAR